MFVERRGSKRVELKNTKMKYTTTVLLTALALNAFFLYETKAGENLLENAGFELGMPEEMENWSSSIGFGTRTTSIASTSPQEGKRHLVLSVVTDDSDTTNGGPGTGPGRSVVAQSTVEGTVLPGKTYTLSFQAASPEGFYTSVAPRYLVEWLDLMNQPVGERTFRSFANQIGPDGYYNEVSVQVTAPPEADRATIFIDLEGGSANNPESQNSVLHLDNVSFKENP